MIQNQRIDKRFVLVEDSITVAEAAQQASQSTFLVVDSGLSATPASRYRVFVANALPAIDEDVRLDNAPFGFRDTKIAARTAITKELNGRALEAPMTSFLIVNQAGQVLGVFIAKGSDLVEGPSNQNWAFYVLCPYDDRRVIAYRPGQQVTCPNGHTFTA